MFLIRRNDSGKYEPTVLSSKNPSSKLDRFTAARPNDWSRLRCRKPQNNVHLYALLLYKARDHQCFRVKIYLASIMFLKRRDQIFLRATRSQYSITEALTYMTVDLLKAPLILDAPQTREDSPALCGQMLKMQVTYLSRSSLSNAPFAFKLPSRETLIEKGGRGRGE